MWSFLSAISLIRCQRKYNKPQDMRYFPRLFADFWLTWTLNFVKLVFLPIQYSLAIRNFMICGDWAERIYNQLRGPPIYCNYSMKMQIKKSGSFTTIKVKSWPRSHSLSLLFPPASKDGAKNKLDLFQNFPSLLSIVKEQKHFQKEETFFDNLFTRKKM